VIINQNNCSDTSACYSILLTGISKTEIADISIEPNPATSHFTVVGEKALHNAQLTITDVTGKQIFKIEINETVKTEVNMTGFEQGIYILNIHSAEFSKTRRLVLTK